jgi:hypothetical protein
MVEKVAEYMGSFLCFLIASRMRVTLRDSIVVRGGSFVPVLSALESLAMMTWVGCICSV